MKLYLNICWFISVHEQYGVSVSKAVTLIEWGTLVGNHHLTVHQEGILVAPFGQPDLERPGVPIPKLVHLVAGRVPLVEGADQAH